MERKKINLRNMFVAVLFMLMAATVLTPVSASAAKVSPKKATLYVGEKKQLKLSGVKGKVTWKSSKKSVAVVNKSGIVTAKKVGKCNILAKKSGKTYKCKVTVKKLPKNYALLNGTRVKVGKTATITYTVQSKNPISEIVLWYNYNRKAIQVVNKEDSKRFASFDWVDVEAWPGLMVDGKVYDKYQLWGINKKNPGTTAIEIKCKKAKTFDKIKVKVLKTGNYKFKSKIEFRKKAGKKVKGTKVTEKIK